MVSSVSANNQGAYIAPAHQNPQVQTQAQPQANALQGGEIDTFISQLEQEHKKAVIKKNCIGGTIAGASALAMLGGSFIKTKWGRALSIAPLALTTLAFGIATLAKGNKTPDYRAFFEGLKNPDNQN